MSSCAILLIVFSFSLLPVIESVMCPHNGWFGDRDQLKCHCKSGVTCDTEIDFDDTYCERGWFGPQCQYSDLATEAIGFTVLTDGNTSTCISVTSSPSQWLTFDPPFRFTWMRLVGDDAQSLKKLELDFWTSGSQSPNHDASLVKLRVNNTVVDVHGQFNDRIQKTRFRSGDGPVRLCSVYVSGGRNVALKQPTSQSSQSGTYRPASLAVDGNTTGYYRMCTHTGYDDVSGTPTWTLTISSPTVDIDRYRIYNRDDSPCRLKFFQLREFYSGNAIRTHTDTQTVDTRLYDVRYSAAKQVDSVTLSVSKSFFPNGVTRQCSWAQDLFLRLCEVEAFGDSVCPSNKWGRQCEKSCNCQNSTEKCYVSTGMCPSGCKAGYGGIGCDKECPEGRYGPSCIETCSDKCLGGQSQCDKTDGKCLSGCQPGYHSEQCDQECPEGKYGPNCSHKCSDKCLGGKSQCDKTDGKCLSGCQPGYHSDQCDRVCPEGRYGPSCSQTCSDKCVGGKSQCDKTDGKCLSGCQSGYHSEQCDQACGGVLTASHGVITSPAYPDNYMNNLDCRWHINGRPGQTVRLLFTDFELEAKSDCVKLYNGNITRSSSELATLCTEEMPSQRTYDSSSNSMVVFFKSDASLVRSGFRATYTINECGGVLTTPTGVITSPNYPDNYLSKMDCYWYINAQPGRIVRLTFTKFNVEPKADCVKLYNGNNLSTSSEIASVCTGEMPPHRIYDSSSHSMVVYFKTDETDVRSGFRATYTIYESKCGGDLTAPTGVITSPNYPDNYFNNLDCFWYINAQPGQTVSLRFTALNLETKSDCVKVYNGNNTSTNLEMEHVCSEDMIYQRTYNSSSNSMVVYFKTDGSVVRSGFKANYTIHGSQCGGVLTAPNGVITSPNYPSNYTNNVECYWYIQAQPGQTVNLYFSDFHLETKFDCVKLYDGLSTVASSETANLCTEGMPSQRTYDSKSMVVHFKTDGSVVNSGFKATYTINECGGVLTAPTGVITSPNYPDDYFNNLDCSWYINAKPGSTVRISFSDFTLEKKFDCVELYNGNVTSTSSEMATLCTEDMPSSMTYVSSTNSMVVVFKSDASVVRSGFRATYTITECGGVLTDPSGVITSPYYPNNYSNNLDCSWYINAQPGRTVSLNISDVNLETKYDCVKLYNGNTTSQISEIANTCTDGVNSQNLTYNSSSNSMVVYFKTDGSVVRSGFYATFTTIGCGGVLTAPTGVITSPNYPDHYSNNMECYWYINGKPEQVVRLAFTDFELEGKSDCVMVYNGNSTSPSSEMANLCTGKMPSQTTYDASHNSMVVYFKTDGSNVRPGFRANYTIIDSECGGVLTAATGVITSPNYPDDYFNNMDCSWYINAQPGQTVSLIFTDFNLESKSDCVKVYNGNSTSTSPEMANLCTEVIPSPRTYNSSSNSMVVYFRTDGSVVRSGFTATYTINGSPRG